jgi:ammonium transporter Rh
MIFVGFGFLMVFLKTHSWSAVGFNFLIACWAIQVNLIMQPAWHMLLIEQKLGHTIKLNLTNLITSDFAAGAVLITMGAVLGKTTWTQLFILGTLELVFFGFNETICVGYIKAVDCGGSMFVHTFGAYFGLAASLFFYKK